MPDVDNLPNRSATPSADEAARLRAVAWSQDWLQQVYGRCMSLPTCQNEFGTAWRYCVPETRRGDKRVGMCLCRTYASLPR